MCSGVVCGLFRHSVQLQVGGHCVMAIVATSLTTSVVNILMYYVPNVIKVNIWNGVYPCTLLGVRCGGSIDRDKQ